MPESEWVLNLSCKDRPRIVSSVTNALALLGANIAESAQFWDRTNQSFFMRIAFTASEGLGRQALDAVFTPMSAEFDMATTITRRSDVPRIIIMVSKFDHCLEHLLYQIRVGWLNVRVVAIVSNHETARGSADHAGIPFHLLPVDKSNKAEQEARLLDIYRDTDAELIVLARYMQVLSNELSQELYGRVINIHHSFLPSFKGAKPYHQAFDRGVKLIGATGHYVTPDLDEGPIIEQEAERVTHALSADDLVAVGRDIEARVLARAVKLHVERRVMLNGRKTVVL
ncbi:formyltetrahydrofolate deformylase [Lichenibacterium dinghuense]|uniref:formyltetrahydrofolate deformylase n=1 Tax=Lichenibacterium dinghuense TaxID=2895977 RepID=UPI001F01C510|nr:formyltetrahydrofolate deformylase [Lichenibacterium sp. 6Y81]